MLMVIVGISSFAFNGLAIKPNQDQQTANIASQAEALTLEHTPYRRFFRNIYILEREAERAEKEGRYVSAIGYRTYLSDTGLSASQIQKVIHVANQCEERVANIDRKAKIVLDKRKSYYKDGILAPGQSLLPPSEELKTLQLERNTTILQYRDVLRTELGEQDYSRILEFIHGSLSSTRAAEELSRQQLIAEPIRQDNNIVTLSSGSIINGSASIVYNELANTITYIASTELDFASLEFNQSKVNILLVGKSSGLVVAGNREDPDGDGFVEFSGQFPAVAGEEYTLTATHSSRYVLRDFNLDTRPYIDRWGFQPIYRDTGEPGQLLAGYLFLPFFANGPRFNSSLNTLSLGKTIAQAISASMPSNFLPGKAAWDKLTNDEKKFVIQHPAEASQFWYDAETAKREASIRYTEAEKRDGWKGNAFQHAYWNYLMARSAGNELAGQFADAHENFPSNNALHKDMDLFNNNYGRTLKLRFPTATNIEIIEFIKQDIDAGRLRVVCPGGPEAICHPRP
jgi:hypothetical protein